MKALFVTLLINSIFIIESYHNGNINFRKISLNALSVETRSDKDQTKETVWEVFGGLALTHDAINLGQGFPDWDPPEFVLESLRQVIDTPFHQYTRPAGHPALVELIAERYSAHLEIGIKRNIDPMNEVAITVGASQALYVALNTLIKSSTDEVLVFDPFFELYRKQINAVGGKMKCISLGGEAATLDDPWALDIVKVEEAITDQTKILILNSPHNPTGKVFTKFELEQIANVIRKYPQITVISDEVYKYTIYAPNEDGDSTAEGHTHFAALPGMWDQTITISSCGKTFSVTGWQTGWIVGPSKFIHPVHELLPCLQFCTATPTQQALTNVLRQADKPYGDYKNYYEWLRTQYIGKRKILEDGMKAVGMEVLPAQGGVFLMARLPSDDPNILSMYLGNEPYDWKYCRMLAEKKGVIGIPASPFFSNSDNQQLFPMARFAFCKKDDTLLEAARRLSL